MEGSCNINTVVVISIVVLIISFANELFSNFPILLNLFTNPINFILLNILVIFVLLIDLPCGIIIAFLILYLSIYVKNLINNKIHNKQDKIDNILITSKLINTSITNANANVITNTNAITNANVANNTIQLNSDSEINYNTRVQPNVNLPPFQPLSQEQIQQNTNQITSNISQNQNDSLNNNTNAINRDGYDVVGCRYDFKDSQQNMTRYGPPLASCETYSKTQIETCGTTFYPLNA